MIRPSGRQSSKSRKSSRKCICSDRVCARYKGFAVPADKSIGSKMSRANTTLGEAQMVWDLPPLILHPFNERVRPAAFLENSKAALVLAGLIPNDGTDPEVLKRRVVSGRYSEIRMLYFLGKDILRWVEQCGECVSRVAELVNMEIRAQSFAGLLIACPPPAVKERLARWGVGDWVSLFSRGIGLNAMFLETPAPDTLTEEFLRNYHRYADALYRCFMESHSYCAIAARHFRFDLYASAEYSRRLAHEWEGTASGTES